MVKTFRELEIGDFFLRDLSEKEIKSRITEPLTPEDPCYLYRKNDILDAFRLKDGENVRLHPEASVRLVII